jgi:hypothetical protein
MSELNENDNLDINTGETGGTPQENTGAAQPSGQSGDGEYHYVKPETTRLYADADYVRQDETTVPPRYYVPPEKTQAKPRRAKVKGSGSGLWWKVACLCLVCALLGGIAGGALAGTSLAKKTQRHRRHDHFFPVRQRHIHSHGFQNRHYDACSDI